MKINKKWSGTEHGGGVAHGQETRISAARIRCAEAARGNDEPRTIIYGISPVGAVEGNSTKLVVRFCSASFFRVDAGPLPPPSLHLTIYALSPISSACGSECKSPIATYVGLPLTRSPATFKRESYFHSRHNARTPHPARRFDKGYPPEKDWLR